MAAPRLRVRAFLSPELFAEPSGYYLSKLPQQFLVNTSVLFDDNAGERDAMHVGAFYEFFAGRDGAGRIGCGLAYSP